MSKSRFMSKSSGFFRKNSALIDMVQGHMAMDIEQTLKNGSGMPVKTGNMKSQSRHFRSTTGGFRVEIDTAYAAYQERGMRRNGTYVVRNYSTGGTGKGFFARAIDKVVRNRANYIEEAKRSLGL